MMTTFNGTPFMEIYSKLPDVNDAVDAHNIEVFDRNDIFNSDQYRHTCVLCGKKCNIDDSVSNKGHKLICISCVYRYFEGDYAAVFNWNKM